MTKKSEQTPERTPITFSYTEILGTTYGAIFGVLSGNLVGEILGQSVERVIASPDPIVSILTHELVRFSCIVALAGPFAAYPLVKVIVDSISEQHNTNSQS